METKVSDEQLVEQTLDGDSSTYEVLVNRYQDRIYRLAYRMVGNRDDAEDLCQDCFVHLYKVLPKYRRGLPFAPWLYKICTNLTINWLHRKGAQPPTQGLEIGSEQETEELQLPDLGAGPEETMITKDQRQRVLDAVNHLPTSFRVPIVLRYLLDLTFREISEILGVPLGTVATRVRRGTEMIRRSVRASERE
jgi:RNA polymerase sigma-70 factor (ECF subfamily)